MMAWTERQQEAIEARGMEVLVSAAAGSGKTAVLTERVKNILCDEKNKCFVSEILVVTFTKAAAAEMRDRISAAMLKTAESAEGDTEHLRNQILMLPTADICTMDSFCAKLVRENFSKANVNFDFRVLDESEKEKLNSEAINKVIDELYEQDDEDLKNLIDMLMGEKNDNSFSDIISKLYEFSVSYPFPDKWLDSLVGNFDENKSINDTPWADTIYKHVELFVDYYLKTLEDYLDQISCEDDFNEDFIKKFSYSIEQLNNLKKAICNRSWDTMVSLIQDGLYISKTPTQRNLKNPELKDESLAFYNDFKKDAETLEKFNIPMEAIHKDDCKILFPAVSKICQAVKRVGEVLDEMKKEMNAYSFDDVLHKAIDLLVVPMGDGTWMRTPLCEGLVERYKEILIDEYQDTNEAQDMLFEALSRNRSNLYVVGDVKQSIYRFRKASPAIFMNLKRNLQKYDRDIHPSQITLDTNFRSREGIDKVTNYIFKSIMSENIGEIDYNDDEKMTFGADYYPTKDTPDSEIMCIKCDNLKSAECTEIEAEAIAKYIYECVNKRNPKIQVTRKDKNGDFYQRDIEYGDFCILLRSVKKTAHVYINALKKLNIPCSSSAEVNLGEYKEIRVLISILKAINNPLMDIHTEAAMMSPVFGFSSDEMAKIRLVDKKIEMYACLHKYAEKDAKTRKFLDKINLYRNLSSSYPIDELVRFIVDDTGIKNIYLALDNGKQRFDNINGFLNFASDFTKNIGGGLGSFINHIDSAIENDKFAGLANLKVADGVKIMTIHKSKGLEFPYVILGGCSKQLKYKDAEGVLTVSKETGIGMQIRDDDLFTKYHTLSSMGNVNAIKTGDMSETLRLLYVAVTRARERIVFVSTIFSDSQKKKVKMHNQYSFDKNGKLHPFAVSKAQNMSELLLTVFSRHKDCKVVRDAVEMTSFDEIGSDFGIDCRYIDATDLLVEDVVSDEVVENSLSNNYDEELLEEIKGKLSVDYDFNFDGVLAKRTASSTEKSKIKKEYFANSKPDFLKTKFTGADRGTAIHKFLEKCDFSLAKLDVATEKQRLLDLGIMNDKELSVISSEDLHKFFDTSIITRLLASDEFLKEYEFSVLKKAGEMYPDLAPELFDEEIVVQGKLDCAFIEGDKAVLIDYKSDGITDESEYVAIYKPQLDIYSEALEKCKGCKVVERYIYSFKLNRFISI